MMSIVHFDSHSDFHHFVYHRSKTIVLTISIKYVVHRAQYFQPCGRHQISRIFNIEIFMKNHMTVTECNEIIHQEEPERFAAI